MNCLNGCGATELFTRGYCQKCYWKLRRNGSLPRANAVNGGRCSIEGCEKTALAKNLCSMHYQRAQHPLMNAWNSIRRLDASQRPEEWTSFDKFLRAVGERPSEKHQLRRINPNLPWSSTNFRWRPPVSEKKMATTEYMRRWQLRDKYGLSAEEFDAILASQNNKCPITGRDFSEIDPATGKAIRMVVDHCHDTGKVRGILSDSANKGIGLLGDNLEWLENAVVYLKSHKH